MIDHIQSSGECMTAAQVGRRFPGAPVHRGPGEMLKTAAKSGYLSIVHKQAMLSVYGPGKRKIGEKKTPGNSSVNLNLAVGRNGVRVNSVWQWANTL